MLGERYLLPCPHLADLGRGWLVLKGKDKGDGGKQLVSQQEKGKKTDGKSCGKGGAGVPLNQDPPTMGPAPQFL